MMIKKLLITLWVSFFIVGASAQTVDFQQIDNYLAKGMTDFNQPGMAVAVIKDGKAAFIKGYGKRNTATADLVDENTVFQLASLSKAFTAASIGILVDEGKLKWDDKVIDHLPGFRLYDPYVTSAFTVRDLLCHRNGYVTFDGDLLWYATNYSRKEIVKRFANLAPKHGFREKYGYSNIMFIAAALLIEEKSGQSWEEFVKQRIFKPLQMSASTIEMDAFLRGNNIAFPHVKGVPNTHINYNNAAGAVGVNANLSDLMKWVNMWLNKGKAGDVQLLKEQTVRDIFSAQTPQNVSAKAEENGVHFKAAACGWMVSDYKGVKRIEHSGGLPGFILNIVLVPEKNLGVIVLTNGESIIPFAATNYIIDSYVSGTTKDWMADYLVAQKKGDAEKKTIDLPKNKVHSDITLPDIAGTYEDKMYGVATITVEGGKAKLTLEPTKTLFNSTLEPLTANSYRIRFADPFLPDGTLLVQLNSAGKPISFTIDLPNPDFNFYNLKFVKL